MKIFAIRDESMENEYDIAYLLYYEREKRFYIELSEKTDPWDNPLILSSFAKRGETTVNSYWSKLWVQQRIVPSDRQNLSQILKDNNLQEYDEYEMLMLSMGRCAQDDCYLVPLEEIELPYEIIKRFSKRIDSIIPLDEYSLLVFFRDGIVKKCNLKDHFEKDRAFKILLDKKEYFSFAKMQPGGYGVEWDINISVSDTLLYEIGEIVPLSAADFGKFIVHGVVNVAEASEILECTRQNIDYLTKTGKLHPVKATGKSTLYFKSEVLKRKWL